MKKFINNPDFVVDEMLEGFLDVHASRVRRVAPPRRRAVRVCRQARSA